MAQPVPAFEPQQRIDHDHIIVLDGVAWADYQRLLEIRGDRPVPRMTYLEGQLELMSPSKSHESIKSMIGCLLEAWCLEKEVDLSPFGSWTLEKQEADRAVEPDECYVLGDNPDAERPDIAIEVIWTSGGVSKLEVYRKLGVREVWIWKKGELSPYMLVGEEYQPIERSELLPELDLAELARFVGLQPMTRAVREYRELLRQR